MRAITFFPGLRPEDTLNRVMFPFRPATKAAERIHKRAHIRTRWELQRYGQAASMPSTEVSGPLFRHRADGINHPDELVRILTPWHDTGIAQWRVPAEQFRDAYPQDAPDPEWLDMDVEKGVWVLSHNWQVAAAYVHMKLLPAWHERPVVYGKTMDMLCADVPDPDPARGWASERNREWALGAFWVYQAAMARALDEALYQPLRERWPNLKCGNYQTDVAGRYYRWHSGPEWLTWEARSFGQVCHPVLYGVSQEYADEFADGDLWQGLLYYTKHCIRQCKQQSGMLIKPWIHCPGEKDRTQDEYEQQKEVCEREGADEVMVWGWDDADWDLA